MRKSMFLVCGALLFATSCLPGGGSPGTSSADYPGYLTVSDISTEEVSYSDDNAKITVAIPNMLEPKFDIVFNSIKFDNAMPVKLNVKFESLPFQTTISEEETTLNYLFVAKNVVPTVGGIPYEKYKVDSIKGCVGRPVTVEFWMSSKDKMVHFSTVKSEENN
jgi:hypothetical protein